MNGTKVLVTSARDLLARGIPLGDFHYRQIKWVEPTSVLRATLVCSGGVVRVSDVEHLDCAKRGVR